jgi:hypothetical protein
MLTRTVSSECETRIVHYIDGLTALSLVRDDISLDTQLGDLGFGPQKCGILERKVNVERRARGKHGLPAGTITVATKVSEVIDYACN